MVIIRGGGGTQRSGIDSGKTGFNLADIAINKRVRKHPHQLFKAGNVKTQNGKRSSPDDLFRCPSHETGAIARSTHIFRIDVKFIHLPKHTPRIGGRFRKPR